MPWLSYDGVAMFCLTCRDNINSDKSSTFVKGTTNFRIDILRVHNESQAHMDSVLAVNANQNPRDQPMDRALRLMNQQTIVKLEKLMSTAYYITLTQQPFSRFKSLCELQKINGCDLGDTYLNDGGCKNLISAIDTVMTQDLINDLNTSKVFSLLTDGSTDSGVIEEEIMYVKYVNEGQVHTKFMTLQAPDNGKAQGLKAAIHEGFNEVGLDNWRTHLASMGTDGASVNTGEQNGLIAIMRRDLPWLVGIWCVAHLFERGLLSSLKEEKFLTDIKELLQGLYKHYQLSPKATKELKEVASALNENTLKPVNILGTRWAPHLMRALDVLLRRNAKSVYTHLCHTAQARDASVKMVGRARRLRIH